MTSRSYGEPIATLLTYGAVDNRRRNAPWPEYKELGFNQEHVPDLIRIATDMDLHKSRSDSVEVWAPLHAWRVLGQLRAQEAAEPLVRLFEQLTDDDWLPSELPKVFSMIGPATIPILTNFLDNEEVEENCRISVPHCLEQVAKAHPMHRDACIGILVHQLDKYRINGLRLNAFLVSGLMNLDAVEAIDVIRKAFLAEKVDLVVAGDLEDVEIEMGLRMVRTRPPSDPNPFAGLLDLSGGKPGREASVGSRRKIGRNDPCPCGSGRKFKKCCLN